MTKNKVKILKWAGVAVVGLTVVYLVLLAMANHALQSNYVALKEDGRPLTRSEVIPIKADDADNAALVYESVTLRLRAEPAGTNNLWRALGTASEGVLAETPNAAAIDEFRRLRDLPSVMNALAEVETGSRRSGYWNDLDYSRGASLELPHIHELIALSRIICADTRLKAAAGKPDAAWQSALTALRVAGALKDEPILICQLVSWSQYEMARKTIQTLPYSVEGHQEAEVILKASEEVAHVVGAFDCERANFGETIFQDLSAGSLLQHLGMIKSITNDGRAGGVGVGEILYAFLRPLQVWDRAYYSKVMHHHAQTMADPEYPIHPDNHAGDLARPPWYAVVSRATLPAMDGLKMRFCTHLARSRVTRAGLAIWQRHSEHQSWPESLPQQEEFIDPFTGKPLIYRINANGFVVYSVGKDHEDDQGKKAKGEMAKQGWGDIVWRYSTGRKLVN